jgi:hypothetical protein
MSKNSKRNTIRKGGTSSPSDFGPPEKLRHGEYRLEPVSPKAFQVRLRRLDSTPFDGMLRDNHISDVQHSAAESFCAIMWRARMLGPSGSNYERSGSVSVGAASTGQLNSFHKVLDALGAVRREAGRECERVLVSAAIDNHLPPNKRDQLVQALDALLTHYTDKMVRPPLPTSLRLAG